jgi:hypothetical protein
MIGDMDNPKYAAICRPFRRCRRNGRFFACFVFLWTKGVSLNGHFDTGSGQL